MTDQQKELYDAAATGRNFRSSYCRFDMQKKSTDLWVFCSHVGIPRGKFAQTRVGRMFFGDKLYLNCKDNSWYQTGVPDIASSLEQIGEVVQTVAFKRSRKNVFIVGHSMGAYLAILLGQVIEQARYLAISPEPILGLVGSRSAKNHVSSSRPLFERIESAAGNSSARDNQSGGLVLYGVFDPIDAYFLQDEYVTSGRYGIVREVFWHHGITEFLNGRGLYVDLLKDFASSEALDALRPDLLDELGSNGAPEQYRDFYSAMAAMNLRDIEKAVLIANQRSGWVNPGWQNYRSLIYQKSEQYEEAHSAARKAFFGAPHVYEHAIQFGKTAMACKDKVTVKQLIQERPKGTYNHVNYDRFVDIAQKWVA